MRRWLGTGLAVAALAGRASGHAVLLDATVRLDVAAVRAGAEAQVALRFSEGIQPRASKVELVPDQGPPRPLPLVFGPGDGDVALTLPALPAGRYALRYHVTAADGHVTDATLPLRVAPPD